MRSILDPKFRYVRSDKTDLRATFARLRREQKAQAEAERKDATERLQKVVGSIKEKKTT